MPRSAHKPNPWPLSPGPRALKVCSQGTYLRSGIKDDSDCAVIQSQTLTPELSPYSMVTQGDGVPHALGRRTTTDADSGPTPLIGFNTFYAKRPTTMA